MSNLDLSPQRIAGLRRAETLARKVNLLLDTIMTEAGTPFDYSAIRDAAQEAGYYISRTRWSLLKSGKEQMIPDEVLRALAAAFNVPPQYLLQEDGELPSLVKANLEHIRIRRRAEVRDFAAQALRPVDPEAFRAVAKILDEDARDLTGRREHGEWRDE
ncbi:hypothetical protein [Paenarthrobacter sp. PH39-S1]|uniref:hypothetical protein n=1 Tax=Paenarthrobacter sp. PH39-S1 TaxID=3046204 RepID=UPI0024BA5448|nr:hypothetical protein [Paenarthrobacter sp. PH39-S1]MDJ0356057.1 hypothetical protein [Paenarthrobacter sp. PH39-S1]